MTQKDTLWKKSPSNLKPLDPQFAKATHFILSLFIISDKVISTTKTNGHMALYNTWMRANYTVKSLFLFT